ncbi:MAG: hypothetical protein AAFV43_14510 [Planctomycetota bacterium]
MAATLETNDERLSRRELLRTGVNLLSQQIWCWGRDVLRAEGNWLVEVGFDRLAAPADREKCSSVYTLQLPAGRRVVLRGFGVFYGDDRLGAVFLPRFEFRPRYMTDPELRCPPWSDSDMPQLGPSSEAEKAACASLTLALIDWIHDYEVAVAERLGADYRQATLDAWKVTRGPIVPAPAMAAAWRSLHEAFAADPAGLV